MFGKKKKDTSNDIEVTSQNNDNSEFNLENYTLKILDMANSEKEHLNFLLENDAPKEMIDSSNVYLRYLRQRHVEYLNYTSGSHSNISEE